MQDSHKPSAVLVSFDDPNLVSTAGLLPATASTQGAVPFIAAQRLRKGAANSARGAKKPVTEALDTVAADTRSSSRSTRITWTASWLTCPRELRRKLEVAFVQFKFAKGN